MRETSPTLRLDPLPDAGRTLFEAPFDFVLPGSPTSPVLFASPHSGSHYPQAMQDALCVPLLDVRRTEDAFIDELFAGAPGLGAGLMAARYARSVVDLNRDPHELDASMFRDGAPRACALPTARVEAGLGCLPRVGARGETIYARLLSQAEGEERLVHAAQHQRAALDEVVLRGEITQTEDDVLAGGDDRLAVGRREDVVGREHQRRGFDLRLEVPPVGFTDLDLLARGDSSVTVAARVAVAIATP